MYTLQGKGKKQIYCVPFVAFPPDLLLCQSWNCSGFLGASPTSTQSFSVRPCQLQKAAFGGTWFFLSRSVFMRLLMLNSDFYISKRNPGVWFLSMVVIWDREELTQKNVSYVSFVASSKVSASSEFSGDPKVNLAAVKKITDIPPS